MKPTGGNHYVTLLKKTLADFMPSLKSSKKFPPTMQLKVLLRTARRTGDKKALAMVESTLKNMARGGIYDHLGGGFHRYSTDRIWLAPHFEKMLYNQPGTLMKYRNWSRRENNIH